MRKSLWTIGLALAIPAVVSAQKVPRFEVFGGYSYGWINGYVANGSLLGSGTGTYPFPSFGSKGWTGSVAFNATRWFAVVADIGGLYAMPTRTISGMPITIGMHERSYLFGPRFSNRFGRWTVFAHALAGEAHASVLIGGPEVLTPIGIVDTKWAIALGAGVDFTVYRPRGQGHGAGQELAIRLGQADWLRTNLVGSRQDNVRISTGVVFRF